MKLNKFLIATLLAMCVIGFSMSGVSAHGYWTKDYIFNAHKGDVVKIYNERITLNDQNTGLTPFESHGSWDTRRSITDGALSKDKIYKILKRDGAVSFNGGIHYTYDIVGQGEEKGTVTYGLNDFTANVKINIID